MITSTEMTHRAGITYRQLDNWIRQGVIVTADGRNEPGSGRPRVFTGEEAVITRAVADLAVLGMALESCKHLAEQLRTMSDRHGHVFVDVAGGITRDVLGSACYVLDLDDLARGLADALASR